MRREECLLSDPDGSHAHAGSDTHAGHTDLLASPPELIKQCADLSGTGATMSSSEACCPLGCLVTRGYCMISNHERGSWLAQVALQYC